MAQRSNTWHKHLFVDGERFRQAAPLPRFLGPGIYPEFANTSVRAKSRVDFVSQASDNRIG